MIVYDRKWQERTNVMNGIGTVFSVSVSYMLLLSIMFSSLIGQLQQAPRQAEAATCSLPTSISTTIELTPLAGDNIIDCSAQDITVTSTGKLIIKSYKAANTQVVDDTGVLLKVGSLTVQSGGEITADGQGYVSGDTDGGSALASTGIAGGSGGGHGGAGGIGNESGGINVAGTPGSPYGNKDTPIYLGGAGGTSGSDGYGGAGGGAIHIQSSGTVTIDGAITANGTNGSKSGDGQTAGGGGAGGSVYVEAAVLAGNGQISAHGGGTDRTAGYFGGGGGGGRIAILCTASTTFPSSNVNVSFGTGSQDGQPGSLVGPGCIPPAPTVLKFYEKAATVAHVDRELAVGELTTHTALTFAGDLVGENLKLEIEIREKDQQFLNIRTGIQDVVASNKMCTDVPFGNDTQISTYCGFVEVSSLEVSKQYKWQARVVSADDISSAWVSYGGNASTEADFTVVGAPVSIIKVAGDNQTAVVGQNVTVNPKIRVVDAAGYGVPFYSINAWQVLTGGGSTAAAQTTMDKWGEGTVEWSLGNVAGINNNTLQAYRSSAPALAAVTFTASAVPGAIASYAVNTTSTVIETGSAFSYQVVAKDMYENTVPFAESLTAVPVMANNIFVPASGTLAPDILAVPVDGTTSSYDVSGATYSFSENIKIKVYDASGHVGYSNSLLFVPTLGSCPAVTIDVSQTWNAIDAPGGIYNCRGLGVFTVKAGAELSFVSYNNGDSNITNDYGVTLLVDSLVVEATGEITANGTGYAAGQGNGDVYGGYGNNGGIPYGNVYNPDDLGSGGDYAFYGTPGAGGGSIKILSLGDAALEGRISANGTDGSGIRGDGGAGGSVWLDVATLSGNGTIRTNGGYGVGDPGGGGSGGRIALFYSQNSGFTLNGTAVQSYGGSSSNHGTSGPGTVYLEQKGVDNAENGVLLIDNNGNSGNFAAVTAGTYQFKQIKAQRYGNVEFMDNGGSSEVDADHSKLTLSSAQSLVGDATKPQIKVSGVFAYTGGQTLTTNGVDLGINGKAVGVDNVIVGTSLPSGLTLYAKTWFYSNSSPYTFGSFDVSSEGIVTMVTTNDGPSVPGNDYGVNLVVSSFSLASGGIVTSDGYGYGAGVAVSGDVHGGYSRNGGGTPYGSVYEPTTLGSGGDYGYYGTPGAGGGAVKITVNGNALVNGTITVNGLAGSGNKYDGGAAGSIWFNTESLSGTGIMRANGGTGAWDPGNGGSGGRIALYYTANNGFPLEGTNIQAFGGAGANGYAGPGTVYVEQKGTDVVHQGTLLVDNNNYAGLFAGVPHGEYAFKQIKTTRNGHVEFMDVGGASADELVHSHLTISSGAGMVGDTTRPQIKVSGLLTYTGAGLLTIDGVDLGLNGKVVGVNDITVGATMPSGLTLYAKTWYNNSVNGYTFGDLTLTGNATMTMVTNNDGPSVYTDDYGVNLTVSALTLATGGVITSDGYGYAAGSAVAGSGDAHGGYSRNGNGKPYGNVYEPSTLGSGGDYGFYGSPGPGGGAMKLTVNGDTVLNGTVTVNGLGGSGNKYDGGAGGSVWLNTEGLSGTGIIRANGGPGNWDPGNGGSGGRIAVYYTTNNGFTLDGTKLQAYGGPGAWGYGGPGTIYLEQKNTDVVHQGILLVDNNNYAGISAGVPHGDYTFKQISVTRNGHVEMMDNGGNSAVDADHSQLTISSGAGMVGDATKSLIKVSGVLNYTGEGILTLNGVDLGLNGKAVGIEDVTIGSSLASGLTLYAKTWYYNATNQHTFGDFVVNGNGVVTVDSEDNGATTATDDYGVTLNLTGLTIASGGKITGDYLGYAKWSAVARASHGGFAGGTPYGNVYEPTTLGSGGTDAFYGDVGAGGGALKLVVSGTTTHDGTISMNGQDGSGNRGDAGAGGSVWLDTNILTGTGIIKANGGNGIAYYGGSGGRIAVYYNTNNGFVTDSIHLQSFGGAGGTGYVGPGTIYVENKGVDTSHQGLLLVDNNGHDGASAGLSSADYAFQEIKLSRYGHVEVLGQSSKLTVSNSASLVGDASKPLLKVSGILDYTSLDTFVINGIDLGINGRLQTPDSTPVDMVVGDAFASELTLFAKGWFYNKTNPISMGNVSVMGNGTIDMVGNTNATSTFTDDEGVYLSTESLDVATGGRIHADGRGYPEDAGPGAGGAHGGYVTNAPTILPQGSFYEPTMLGSGGGWGFYGTPGDGGGAMKITVSGIATINGTVSADATYGSGNWFGGAAGGSIWLNVGTISGSGIVRANGSNGAAREAGSGGRIAVYYQENAGFTFDATHTQALGGAGASGYGGPGTVYTEEVGVHRTRGGNLSILNNAHVGRGQDFEAGTYELNDLTIGQNVSVWVKSDLTAVSDPLGLVAPHELQADDSTVGLFHFSEAGSTFTDASGNGHAASAQSNVVSSTNGKFGGAQYVNNANYGINFESIALPGDWSADMWVKFPLPGTVDGWRTLLQLHGTSYHNIIIHANGQLGAYNYGWYDSGYNVNSLTGWHHVAAVASGSSTHFYIDGADVGSIAIAMHTNVNVIGNAGHNQNAGYIDEVRLQSKAMTQQEVLDAANATEAYQTTTDTIALWHLDEEVNFGGDSSAQGAVSVQVGTVATVDGKFGKGRQIASGQVIRTTPITIGSEWTIDMWSMFPLPATGTWRSMVARNTGTYHHIMVSSNGQLGTYNGGWADSGYNLNSLSGWHHVAAVGTGTQTKFYIDGVYVGLVNTKITEPVSAFGNTEGAPYHTGMLDELRVRTRALTAEELLAEVTTDVQQSNDADTVYFNHLNAPLQNVTADSKTGNTAATLFGTGSTQGKYGLARNYMGINDYVQLPPTTYDFTQGMSFSFWAKPTASPNYARFVDFGNASSSDNILIFRMGTSNNMGVQIFRGASSPTYLDIANVIINNEWHFYTVTQSATGAVVVYRDGTVMGTGTLQTPLTVQRNLNYVGKSHWGDAFYQGSIDELQIHNRALSAEEIKAAYKGLTLLEYQEYQQNLVGKGVQFDLTGDFTLATGAQILGTGVGFPADNGQGRGERGVGYSGGAGGANGGDGGDGQSDGQNAPAQGGAKYGNQLLPITLGAGGGSSGAGKAGGSGGGSLVVLAHGVQNAQGVYEKGNILIDGSITMDGTVGLIGSPGGGGGSGGSILLHGNTCSVNGTLSAVGGAGGNSDVDGGNGGGGRISVLYNVGPCTVGGAVNYGPGVPADPLNFSASSGQSGTFPPEPNSVPWAPQYKEQFELKETSSSLNTRLAKVNTESSSVLGVSESAIPVGGIINGTTVTLKADAYDAGARAVSPKGLKIQVELKKVGQSFDGVSNLYESALVSFSGGQPLVLTVTISNLEMGASYKWRVRTVNVDNSLLSDWREYGDNSSDSADFSITTVAAIELELEKSSMDLSEYSSVTVIARNSLGDIDTSYRGTVSFRSSSDTAQLPVSYTFDAADNGQHTFVNGVKFFETGTFTVTVEDTINPSLVGTGSITVSVPQIPFISIGASATTIDRGSSTVISWVSNYITNLSIDQSIGNVSEAGSQEVSPTETTTYTITGYNSQNEEMTASVTITVDIVTTTVLTTTMTVTGTPTTPPITTIIVSDPPITASLTVTPTPTTTRPVITPPVLTVCPVINSFSVSEILIKKDRMFEINWAVTQADKVAIDLIGSNLPASGSVQLSLKDPREATLLAVKGNCQRKQTVHIEVVNAYPWEGAGGALVGLFVAEAVTLQMGIAQGNIWFALAGMIDNRKKRTPWGVAYNSVTKKLVSRVIIRLWDAETGKLVDTVVADANGIFKLTPKKGKYIIKAIDRGYVFPSKLVQGNIDSGYTNIYKGEVIEITSDKQILMISIPLDPVKNTGVNQLQRALSLSAEVVALVSPIVLVGGFVYSVVVTVMYPLALNYAILGLYALAFTAKMYVYLSKPKLFGTVTDVEGTLVSGLELGLFDKEFNNVVARTFTNKKGEYNFVVQNKEYYLKLMDSNYRMLHRSNVKDGLPIHTTGTRSNVRLVTENLMVYSALTKEVKKAG